MLLVDMDEAPTWHINSGTSPVFEIVVARYEENLAWLQEFRSETVVYCKGNMLASYRVDHLNPVPH